ncbi:RRQRL motif-containing zinc-binding protein [Streptomyces sp. AK02-04a]|uniref:RRQRL motif-containing zinc-binding protein n=1 Tax=Streptomyces sp. AK02-04a TaxID=3028649 RepID=UPI0029CA7EBC|nr:RRQRL motif-containing zinc-binding protein [Streptomyces sp. AK02-04a]
MKPNPRRIPDQDHPIPRRFSPEHRPDPSNPLVSAYDWGTAPEGLATRRQLRALGLRPAGQEPIVLRCRPCGYWPGRVCTRPTYLYRIDRAKPVRPMTLAQERALDRAMEARTRCPKCWRRYHHCLKRAILHRMQHTTSAMKGLLPARTALYAAALG